MCAIGMRNIVAAVVVVCVGFDLKERLGMFVLLCAVSTASHRGDDVHGHRHQHHLHRGIAHEKFANLRPSALVHEGAEMLPIC